MYTRNEHHRFPLSIRDKGEREGWLQRFEGAAEGIAGGGWRRLRMRDGRSKTATDNKSYDDTFYRSIGERRRLRPAWKGRSWRESSSFLERDHLCCLGERGCPVLARRQSITLGTYYPPLPPDSTTQDPSTRLLAPPNTIHLPYPRPLAPSASRRSLPAC